MSYLDDTSKDHSAKRQPSPSGLTAPFRRINTGRNGHRYVDAHNRKVPGVTTLLSKGLPKPALTNWAARTAAEYAVDNWDELSEDRPSSRLARIKDAPWKSRDAAALRGTKLHYAAEQLQTTGRADVEPEQIPLVESYLRFVDDWQPEILHTEAAVYSVKHGYAGTLDLIAELCDGQRWLLDLKTSNKGVYGDMALQLAAYRYAEILQGEDAEVPMPAVDQVGIVHVRADGYDLVPLTAGPAQFRAFLYVAQVAKTADTLSELVGAALTPNQTEVIA